MQATQASDALTVVAESPEATIGTYGGTPVVLVTDSSRAGWAKIRKSLDRLGFLGPNARLRQLGWWADGVELWTVETT